MKQALYATVASLALISSANADVTQHQQTPEALVEFVYSQFKSDDAYLDPFMQDQRENSIYRGGYLKTLEIETALKARGNHCLDYFIEIGNDNYDPAEVRENITFNTVHKDDSNAIIEADLGNISQYGVKWYLEKTDGLWYIIDAEELMFNDKFSIFCTHFERGLEIYDESVKNSPQEVIEYIYSYYINRYAFLGLTSSHKVFRDGYKETLERMLSYSDDYEHCWDQDLQIGVTDFDLEEIARTIRYETDIQSEDTAVVTVSLYEGDDHYIADWFLKRYNDGWHVVDLQDRATGELFSEQCPPI